MDLDCMSPRACPACWHFRAGQCALVAALRGAIAPLAAPAMMHPLALGSALA